MVKHQPYAISTSRTTSTNMTYLTCLSICQRQETEPAVSEVILPSVDPPHQTSRRSEHLFNPLCTSPSVCLTFCVPVWLSYLLYTSLSQTFQVFDGLSAISFSVLSKGVSSISTGI